MKNFRELMEPFPQYFQMVIADTPELMRKVHEIRYEVFCKEFHFEREEDCPGGMEKDDYDAQSTHCLILHRSSAQPAGCIRLIHIREDDLAAPLPIERYCGASLYPGEHHPSQVSRSSLCEISRLAVSGQFRRRQGESRSPTGATWALPASDEVEYRIFPLLSFALFLGVFSLAICTRRRASFAMMEPWLARHLQIMGFSFRQVGDVIDYHGPRAAFYYTLEWAIADRERRPALRQLFELIDPIIEQEALRTGLIS